MWPGVSRMPMLLVSGDFFANQVNCAMTITPSPHNATQQHDMQEFRLYCYYDVLLFLVCSDSIQPVIPASDLCILGDRFVFNRQASSVNGHWQVRQGNVTITPKVYNEFIFCCVEYNDQCHPIARSNDYSSRCAMSVLRWKHLTVIFRFNSPKDRSQHEWTWLKFWVFSAPVLSGGNVPVPEGKFGPSTHAYFLWGRIRMWPRP